MATSELLERSFCPWCGSGPLPRYSHRIGAAPGYRDPEPGDVTVCVICAQPMRFNAEGLERITQAEVNSLPFDIREMVVRAMQMIRALPHSAREGIMRGEHPPGEGP